MSLLCCLILAPRWEIFKVFSQQLVASLDGPRYILIDNLNVHKHPENTEIFENAGHTITYRPKYSPVLGPIKLSVHDLKTYLRRHREYINDDNLLEWVSTSSIAGYVDDFL